MSLMKIVKNLGKTKHFGVEFTKEPNLNTVARVIDSNNDDVIGFLYMDENSENPNISIDDSMYEIEPMIPLNKSRIAIIISGESDQGKSTIGAMLTRFYINSFPGRKVYFVSQKRKHVDRNFSKFDEMREFSEQELIDFKIEDYNDCLFVIDDSDFGTSAKAVFNLLNLVSTVGREQRVSYIFITHFSSRLNATKAFSEYQIYITFNESLINNRMLEHHMKIPAKRLEQLKKLESSFYAFNKIFRVIIGESFVERFDA